MKTSLLACVSLFFWAILPFHLAAEYVVYDLNNLPTAPTPPNETPYTAYSGSFQHQRGPKTMLFVYVVPSDGNEPSQKTFAALQNELNDTSRFYYDQSFRRTWFGPKVTNPGTANQMITPGLHVVRVDLPKPVSSYSGNSNFGVLQSDTIAAVRALGGAYDGGHLDPNRFDRIQAYGSPKLISSTGLAYVGGKFSWSGNTLSGGTVRHELGHNWGVIHANRWNVNDGIPRSPDGSNSEYNDGADVMGGSGHFNAMFKSQLGFLDSTLDEVLVVPSSGTYRLFAHTNPESRLPETNVRSLLLPVTGTGALRFNTGKKVFLGFRHGNTTPGLVTRASWDTRAVQLHSHNTSPASNNGTGANDGSHLLDTTPGSRQDDDRLDAALKIGRTYSEGPEVNGLHMYGGMHVTPIAYGSIEANGFTHHYLDVVVNYGAFTGNQPPVVSFGQTLFAVTTGVPTEFTITASDPDGDSLAYDWDFGNGGYSILNSATQTYTWNAPGLYLMSVTVSDKKGGVARAEAWINVGEIPFQDPQPPVASLPGLAYRYFHGTFNALPNFTNLLAVKEGTVETFSIAPRERNIDFAFTFEGYLDVPTIDVYTFFLRSNDGSRLTIGENLVIDFDGLKTNVIETSANIALNPGVHPIRLEYFHKSGNELLELSWSTLSSPRTVIGAESFTQRDWTGNDLPLVSLTAPAQGAEFTVGGDISITAEATDMDGISVVQYFVNGAYLGEAVDAPYTYLWEKVSVGNFTMVAVATDGVGRKNVSAPINFAVVSPPPTRVIGLNFGATDANRIVYFNERAGAVYAEPNWNNFGAVVGVAEPLVDNAGNLTPARVTFETNGTRSGNLLTLGASDTASGRLMRGGMQRDFDIEPDPNPNPTALVEAIPFMEYDVYVYFDYDRSNGADTAAQRYVLTPQGEDPWPARFGMNSLLTNDDLGDYPNYDIWNGFRESVALEVNAPVEELLGNYVVFRNVTGPGFRIEATRRNGTTKADGTTGRHRRYFNAVQVVEVPATTPQIRVAGPAGGWQLEEGGAALGFTLQVSIAPDEPVEVVFDAGDQLMVEPAAVTFTAENWQLPQWVSVTAIDDQEIEGDHTGVLGFSVQTSGLYASVSIPPIEIAIADNDQPTVGVYALGEPAEQGEVPGIFRLIRSADNYPGLSVTVPFTIGGTATPGQDYSLSGSGLSFDPMSGMGSVVIPGGVVTVDLILTPVNDTTAEGPESVILELLETPLILLGQSRGQLNIVDNDAALFFTQRFGVGEPTEVFNLAFQKITFTPNGSSDFYGATIQEVTAFPSSFSGHVNLKNVTVTSGSTGYGGWEINQPVGFYGVSYPKFFINTNGHLTFHAVDNSWQGTISQHFQQRRISAFFRDLNVTLNNNGGVYWGRVNTAGQERTVVTYHEIARTSSSSERINVQVELWDNGVITLTWLNCHPGASPHVVGLSRVTGGIPAGFVQTNLSALPRIMPGGTPGQPNYAPLFQTVPPAAAVVGQPFSYAIEGIDPNGDPLTMTAPVRPAWMDFVDLGGGSGLLSGTPPSVGSESVVLHLSDGLNTSAQSFSLAVNPGAANTPPVFLSEPGTSDAARGRGFSYLISATDADGEALTFSLLTAPGWLTLTDFGNGAASLGGLVPEGAVVGSLVPVIIGVSDGIFTTTQSFSLTIRPSPSLTLVSPRSGAVALVDRDIDLHLIVEADGEGYPVIVEWSHFTGPGGVQFSSPNEWETRIRFDSSGYHEVRVEVNNGFATADQIVRIFVEETGESQLTTDLLAYWRMNETEGLVLADSSGNNLEAILSGTVILGQEGVDGGAIRLSGSQNFARAEIPQPNVFTLSAWIQTEVSPATGARAVFSFNNNTTNRARLFQASGSRRLHFISQYNTGGEWRLEYDLPVGTWVHVVLTYDRSSTANHPLAYINGQPVGVTQLSLPSGGNNSSNNLRLGSTGSNNTSWVGLLDEMRLYSRVVPPEEIPLLMNAGLINQAPAVQAGPDFEVVAGHTVLLLGEVSDDGFPENPGLVSVQWSQDIGPGPGTFGNPENPGSEFTTGPWGGTYILRLAGDDGDVKVSQTMQVNVTDGEPFAPIIFSQPVSLVVAEGQSASFTVSAGGDPEPTFQWYFENEILPGATSPTLTIENVTGANAGAYSVEISNDLGTVFSVTVELTLAQSPVFLTQPASQTVAAGEAVSFSVEMAGRAPFTYQWMKNGSPLGGPQGPTYTIPVVSTGDEGLYTVSVTNDDGSETSQGAVLVVLVNQAPVITMTSPTLTKVSIPEEVGLVVEGTVTDDGLPGGPVTQAWSVVQAPPGAQVAFDPSDDLNAFITFNAEGDYILRLTASDGLLSSTLDLTVGVGGDAGPGVPTENLAAWLRLDESNGLSAGDSSGNGRIVTLTGSPVWQPSGGAVGGALEFTGSGQIGEMAESTGLDGVSQMSWAMWLNPAANNNDVRGVLAKRVDQNLERSWAFFLHTNNQLSVDIGATRNSLSSAAPANQWTHLAVVFDGTLPEAQRLRFYRNGELALTANPGHATVPTGSAGVTFGTLNLGDNRNFRGLMDEVLIYQGKALSVAEIEAIISGTGGNLGPMISFAPVGNVTVGAVATIEATVTDDGLPELPGAVTTNWWLVSGPGLVDFGDVAATTTSAVFSSAGSYVVRLVANDGEVKTGRNLTLAVEGGGTTPFDQWLADYGRTSQNPDTTYVWKQGQMVTLREAFLLGEDPDNPNDYLRLQEVSQAGTTIQFRFTTLPNRLYYLEHSDNLVQWTSVPGWEAALIGTGQEYQPSLPRIGSHRFYRVRIIFAD